MKPCRAGKLFFAMLLAGVATHGYGQTVGTTGGTLLQFDFNGANPWPHATATGAGSTPELRNVGTVDVAGGKEPSGGLWLAVQRPASGRAWRAAWSSGPLAVHNAETHPGKLTLSFCLSVSATHPVSVRLESLDAQQRRSGGLEAQIYPAAPAFYQRYALDLSAMKAVGAGSFKPTDPFVGLTLEVSAAAGWSEESARELRLDNVHYARPAYYVSSKGSDTNDGRTEQTALATPQKAVAAAQPGDIILLMEGTYPSGRSAVTFRHGGTPAAWIALKNYPGHAPLLLNETWGCITIGDSSKTTAATRPAVAYIEVRGLHIRGNANVADKKYPDALNRSDPRTNGNGLAVEGRYTQNTPHHLRFADNVVEYNSGAGISVLEADWVTIENNITRNNCWWMIFAGSGISILGASNFDATEGGYKHLVRNNVSHGNRCFLKWKTINQFSDGNGIILDVNRRTHDRPEGRFLGRTLVQGNLSYNNGGSGIHAFKANRVDIINNTAWMNSASPELQYGQIFAQDCTDVRLINNILVAPVANVSAGEKPETINGAGRCTNVVYAHNLYFGGNKPPRMGEGDRVADPLFVRPSTNAAVADFHLQPGSPALKAGRRETFGPLLDLDGKLRPSSNPPDLGVYQK